MNRCTPLLTAALLFSALLPSGVTAAPNDASVPAFQMPFPCGQTWQGETRADHKPLYSVDLNREDDLGDSVVASAPGRVLTAKDDGDRSYGKYVVIDHGDGWTTYYGHLHSLFVSPGVSVAQGAKLGTVGSTGSSTGPHLHFEQRYNGTPRKIVWNGERIYYNGSRAYSSHNACGAAGTTGETGAQATREARGTVTTAKGTLAVRSGPGIGYSVVSSVSSGSIVPVLCQTRGTRVAGTYGSTDRWNRIGDGLYVSDAFVKLAKNTKSVPACSKSK